MIKRRDLKQNRLGNRRQCWLCRNRQSSNKLKCNKLRKIVSKVDSLKLHKDKRRLNSRGNKGWNLSKRQKNVLNQLKSPDPFI